MPNKIFIPAEIFNKLSREDADNLQEELMTIYFKNNPEILNNIIITAKGDPDKLEAGKEKSFEDALAKEYGYDIDILRRRENDEIASRLVEEIDKYNQKVETFEKG
jgi:hypothetical protein